MSAMTEKEKALAGLEFIRGSRELKAQRERAELLCFRLNTTPPDDHDARNAILRELIGTLGEGASIKSPFLCDYGQYISLGRDFFANYNCKMIDGGKITFGENVLVGPDCTFVTVTHAVDPDRRRQGIMQYLPITVGDNVWFGAGVTVCPGVTIGDNCVIGAGSVVVKDIPANCVAVGNPCKVVRSIKKEENQ